MSKKIGIIGFGNMGSAFYYGLRESDLDLSFLIYDRNINKLDRLPNVHRAQNIDQLIRNSDVILLAIKPQAFDEFAMAYRGSIDHQMIISMMAGISIDYIKKNLCADQVIRCMPNLPVKVKGGVVGWVANQSVSDMNKKFVQEAFFVLGNQMELKNESMIDALTLVTGCGPGYLYYFIDLLAKKAEELGFSKEESQALARETFMGSAEFMKHSPQSPAELKESVACKGGVTEAALGAWQSGGFEAVFNAGIEAAKKKAEELNH